MSVSLTQIADAACALQDVRREYREYMQREGSYFPNEDRYESRVKEAAQDLDQLLEEYIADIVSRKFAVERREDTNDR